MANQVANNELNAITRLRYGLQYEPPTIILEYLYNEALFHHFMPLRTILFELQLSLQNHSAHAVCQKLQEKHAGYIDSSVIDLEQLQDLIQKLLQGKNSHVTSEKPYDQPKSIPVSSGAPVSGAKSKEDEEGYEEDFEVVEEDAGIVEEEGKGPNEEVEIIAEERQEHHEEKIGKQEKQSSEVPELDALLSELDSQLKDTKTPVSNWPLPPARPPLASTPQSSFQVPERDLNSASDFVVRSAKAAMNVVFEKNALKPGDPGYAYDKKVEFGTAEEESGWD